MVRPIILRQLRRIHYDIIYPALEEQAVIPGTDKKICAFFVLLF
jgi:hypothetical protein